MPASFSATERACFGSQASSPASSLSCLPSTPPAALMSATANSAPFFICRPKVASLPVIGPAMPTVMSWAEAVPASAKPVPSASAASRSFFMLCLPWQNDRRRRLCRDGGEKSSGRYCRPISAKVTPLISSFSRLAINTGLGAPSEGAGAPVKPGVLGDHLGGAGDPPAEAADDEKEGRIGRIGERRQQIGLEQGEVDETDRRAEQRHVGDHVPERPPGAGNGTAGKPRGAAADERSHQQNLERGFRGVDRVH